MDVELLGGERFSQAHELELLAAISRRTGQKVTFTTVQNGDHPDAWRGWFDFGTGAQGDMFCHNLNMSFAGLDLRNPISVVAKTSGHQKESFPQWSVIEFEFAANDKRPGLKLFSYDGGKLPPAELFEGLLDEGKKRGQSVRVVVRRGNSRMVMVVRSQ